LRISPIILKDPAKILEDPPTILKDPATILKDPATIIEDPCAGSQKDPIKHEDPSWDPM